MTYAIWHICIGVMSNIDLCSFNNLNIYVSLMFEFLCVTILLTTSCLLWSKLSAYDGGVVQSVFIYWRRAFLFSVPLFVRRLLYSSVLLSFCQRFKRWQSHVSTTASSCCTPHSLTLFCSVHNCCGFVFAFWCFVWYKNDTLSVFTVQPTV